MVTPSMWWPVASTPLASPGTLPMTGRLSQVIGRQPHHGFEDFVTRRFVEIVPRRVDQLTDSSRRDGRVESREFHHRAEAQAIVERRRGHPVLGEHHGMARAGPGPGRGDR